MYKLQQIQKKMKGEGTCICRCGLLIGLSAAIAKGELLQQLVHVIHLDSLAAHRRTVAAVVDTAESNLGRVDVQHFPILGNLVTKIQKQNITYCT